MPSKNGTDVVCVRFPIETGTKLRVHVAGMPHYKNLSQFVTLAVQEKIARETFVKKPVENVSPEQNEKAG